MAACNVLLFPQEKAALRKKSNPIQTFDRVAVSLAQDLKDTLTAHPEGIGLAAPQIGIHQRAIVIRPGAGSGEEQPAPLQTFLNPEILDQGLPREDFDGCLSFPGLYGTTIRPHFLHIRARNEAGEPQHFTFQGFDAVVVHHEIDHLEGILFIDRIENMADLYTITEDQKGEIERCPLSATPWKTVLKSEGIGHQVKDTFSS